MIIQMQTSKLVHSMLFYRISFIRYADVKRLAARILKAKNS